MQGCRQEIVGTVSCCPPTALNPGPHLTSAPQKGGEGEGEGATHLRPLAVLTPCPHLGSWLKTSKEADGQDGLTISLA